MRRNVRRTVVNTACTSSNWTRASQAFESSDVAAGTLDRAELVRGRKKNAQLAKELHRKEKALAEAAALLILSKKAQAIWGTGADD